MQFDYGSQFASYEPNAIKIWASTATATSSLTINDLRITTPGVTGETVFPGASIAVSQASGTVFQEIIIAGIDFQSVSGGTVTLEGNVTMQFGADPALRGSALQFHVIATHIPWVDLDVDSNNDGTIDRTNGRNGTDDRIEQAAPGKIIPVGGDRAEMLVTLPAGRNATLEIDAAVADNIRVHKVKDRTQNTPLTFSPATANTPAKLDLSLLQPNSTTGTLNTWQLWVEALAPSTTAGDLVFTLTGDSSGPPASDIVRATAVAVDLDVDSNNDGRIDPDNGPAGTDDPIEEAPLGRIIFVNSDDDNRNGIADLLDGGGIAGEDDLGEVLLALTPSIGPAVGTLIVTYDETVVRLYKRPDRSGGIVSGGPIPADASVYAEGRIAGTSLVTVTWTVGGLRASDTIRLTVQPYPATIDVDVDSDNNNDFGPPDRSEWEDALENHEYAIGKLIMLDNPQRTVTPVWLQLPTDLPARAGNVRVRIDWNDEGPAGSVRLWNRAVIDALRNPAPADEGGNRIFPGSSYKLSALNYDATTGRIVIYAEGIKENAALKTLAGVEAAPRVDERIRGTLVVNGDDSALDEVKYIVANEDSFYYALHKRQEVRNALASRGVYSFADMPKFSLQRKSPKDLGLGDSDDFPLSPHVPGFKAMVYQDYITGIDQYVLAFGGTDDNNPFTDGDWTNNLQQAFGRQAPQYTEAMKIADGLARNPKVPKGHLVVTGHSLGGGLASAAAAVAGAPADTFNASWLHLGTLLTSDDNGTPFHVVSIDPLLTGYEIYPGALANLSNAQNTIDAYFVDYDILTRVQQVAFVALDRVLIAPVGSMTKLDSPYDVDMAVAALPSFGTVAATIMFTCHKMNVVLYGLLVKEGTPTVDMLGYSLDDLRR